MAYYAGERITDTVIVLTPSGAGATGTPATTFTETTCLGPDGLSYALTITSLGGGIYEVSFQTSTSVTGTYSVKLVSQYGKTYFQTYDVDGPAYRASGGTGASSRTLAGLRRRIGMLTGDILLLTNSAASTAGTTVTDPIHLAKQDGSLFNRQAYIATGAAAGHLARVTANSKTARTMTISPAAPATIAVGDEVELWHERDTGPLFEEVTAEINNCITSVADHVLSVEVSAPTTFVAASPVLDITGGWLFFNGAEWLDLDNRWKSIPPADLKVDPALLTVEVEGRVRWLANNRSVRLRGLVEAQALQLDTDETSVDPEWIVYQAAANLMIATSQRSLDVAQAERKGQYFQTLADSRRPKTLRRPRGMMIRLG